MDEFVDIVDELGQLLRPTVPRSEAHASGLLHTTVIAGVRVGDDWALVRQSADRQDAGQLVLPVGGHVMAGELEIDALRREVAEEIGVQRFTYELIGRARFHRQILGRNENHLFAVYEIRTQDPIVLGAEAETFEVFTEAALKQALHTTPQRFGDAFYFTLEKFYPHVLPPTWQTRWT